MSAPRSCPIKREHQQGKRSFLVRKLFFGLIVSICCRCPSCIVNPLQLYLRLGRGCCTYSDPAAPVISRCDRSLPGPWRSGYGLSRDVRGRKRSWRMGEWKGVYLFTRTSCSIVCITAILPIQIRRIYCKDHVRPTCINSKCFNHSNGYD